MSSIWQIGLDAIAKARNAGLSPTHWEAPLAFRQLVFETGVTISTRVMTPEESAEWKLHAKFGEDSFTYCDLPAVVTPRAFRRWS